jgi:hypothetical protein
MSTLDVSTYMPVSAGLSNYGGGPEAKVLNRLTAEALERLAHHSVPQAALNDLFTLQQEAGDVDLTPETVELAKRFLLAWPKALPMPELALDSDGEVLLDWAGSNRRLVSVSLRSDGRVAYASQLSPRRTAHGTDAFNDTVPEAVVDAVRALFSAPSI